MIIPIGHDRSISRFPFVTIGIMTICLLVQVYATIATPSEAEIARIHGEKQQLIQQIWRDHGKDFMREHAPEMAQKKSPRNPAEIMARIRQMRGLRRQFTKEFEAGKIVPKDSPQYVQWQRLDAKENSAHGVLGFGYRPQNPHYTLITYAFVHGGWLHLIGNMLFLWLCGCNMEDRWGRFWWSVLFVGGAVVSALAFALMRKWNVSAPLVGASGAIAAAMGAFLVVHYNASIKLFYFIWYRLTPHTGTFEMKAYWALPLWFIQQIFGTFVEGPMVPVAYSAHVGGFVVGVLAAVLMKVTGSDRRLVEAEVKRTTVFEQSPLYLTALDLQSAGKLDEARTSLQQLLRQDPTHIDGAIALVNVLVKQDDGDAAAAAASKAIVLCARNGDTITMRQIYADLRDRFPDHAPDARALFAVGEGYHQEDPQSALGAYQEIVRRYPEENIVPKVLLRAAELYAGPLKDPGSALQVLERVISGYAGSPFADRALEMQQKITSP